MTDWMNYDPPKKKKKRYKGYKKGFERKYKKGKIEEKS